MVDFLLYRLKIEYPVQGTLFPDEEKKSSDIILSAVIEKPTSEARGRIWRIGNIEQFRGEKCIFFALGKIKGASHSVYDETSGDFATEIQEEAPHTHVAIDLELQVCAIARKTTFAQDIKSPSRNLTFLLNESKTALDRNLKFVLDEIIDPEAFLKLVKNAEVIRKFEFSLSKPNPWDADDQFQKPFENFVQATNGKRGKASVSGENLNKEVLGELARSAAATGNQASARLKSRKDTAFSTKKLSGNQAQVICDGQNIHTTKEKLNLFKKIRSRYHHIRGENGREKQNA